MEVHKTRGFRQIAAEKPLFPSFLFCRLNKDDSLAHVRWTKGVEKILPESVEPIPVEDEVLLAIQSLE